MKLMIAAALITMISMNVHAAVSDELSGTGGNPLLQNMSPPLSDDSERLELLEEARRNRDIEGILAYANPEELGELVTELYGNHSNDEARQLPKGANVAGYAARIDVQLSIKPGEQQRLEMKFMNPDGTPGSIKAKVSGGARTNSGGTMSDLLKGHCFAIDQVSPDVKTIHGDTLVQPIFFRGKRGPGNSEIIGPRTYAIHGLLGEGYIGRLGTPASHGCIRVAREDAKALRAKVMQLGASNVVICVK